ncbi:MAG: hypothetical protein JOZ92_01210, partial [Candidatus Dormibacteraeota bacterium]|nr:hypothetical protein [Candidatus Dormibacteraeota bacterium]
MNITALALQWVLGLAFGILGAASAAAWLRHRDPGRRFLTLSIALLGVVGVLSSVETTADPFGLINDVTLVLFTLSGWAFLLFRDNIVPLKQRTRIAAAVAVGVTVVLLLVAYAPLEGATSSGPLQAAAALLLLLVWGACVVEPLVRFWSLSTRLRRVQRSRLRALAAAYGGIVLVLLLSVAVGVVARGDLVYRAAYV